MRTSDCGYGSLMDSRLDELLELEHAGWRSLCDGTGSDVYGRLMSNEARMVLANGMIMTRSQVVESLADAPRWAGYEIDEPTVVRICDTVATLLYTGTGHRDGGDDFTGVMASTYVRHDDGWKLALYQQTAKH